MIDDLAPRRTMPTKRELSRDAVALERRGVKPADALRTVLKWYGLSSWPAPQGPQSARRQPPLSVRSGRAHADDAAAEESAALAVNERLYQLDKGQSDLFDAYEEQPELPSVLGDVRVRRCAEGVW